MGARIATRSPIPEEFGSEFVDGHAVGLPETVYSPRGT